MCCDTKFIVADEPTGNLDEETSRDIIRLFQELAHKENKCIILVTHEQEVAKESDVCIQLKTNNLALFNCGSKRTVCLFFCFFYT